MTDTLKVYTVAHGSKVSLAVPRPRSSEICWTIWFMPPPPCRSTRTICLVCSHADHDQTTNLIINLEHDDWILNDHSKSLADIGAGVSLLRRRTVYADCLRRRERDRAVVLQSSGVRGVQVESRDQVGVRLWWLEDYGHQRSRAAPPGTRIAVQKWHPVKTRAS